MNTDDLPKLHPTAAQAHFLNALRFYEAHGQSTSAIAQLTAGLLALSVQLTRVERRLAEAREC